MPIIKDDLDLPIKRPEISGPGVDAIENRKEVNHRERVTIDELRANYEKAREGIIDGIKSLDAT